MNPSGGKFRAGTLVVFIISLTAITSELCLSLVLGLKAYSHMVYVVIAFALLGYGIGSCLCFLAARRLSFVDPNVVSGTCLLFISLAMVVTAWLLPSLRIHLRLIYDAALWKSIAVVYVLIALPFVGIGFLISYIFSSKPEASRRLYFWDLLGAGSGAVVFFPLLPSLGPIRLLVLLAVITLVVAIPVIGAATSVRKAALAGMAVLGLLETGSLFLEEPRYDVDPEIGWEWIPGFLGKHEYKETWRAWHPLGRTDLHQITDAAARAKVRKAAHGAFQICLDPPPEFSYFTNNYRAGTPVFELSQDGLARAGSRVKPFSQSMECPYLLLEMPRVLVIGAGGGRDVFMARVHGASQIIGAEINPATYRAMASGGVAHEYSGRIYSQDGVTIHNIDGRHLVGDQTSRSQDLVILNGVDTFAALSTGSYAFAENYLYTREAIIDYLRILDSRGLIFFNRWFDGAAPREVLRLFVMILDAVRADGGDKPGNHVIIGDDRGWGIIMVKRTPYAPDEVEKVLAYFKDRHVDPVYVPGSGGVAPENLFYTYVRALERNEEKTLIDEFTADISVVRDDSPFFYKYYRFNLWDTRGEFHPGGGATAFHVQQVIIIQTVIFILVMTLVTLNVARRKKISLIPSGARVAFFLYFAALGLGFIFIEITLMQRFTLALGSPIYSVSVVLATLLMATGIGSLLSDRFRTWAGTETRMIAILAVVVVVYLIVSVLGGTWLLNLIAALPFPARVVASMAALAPLGVCLGVFFPSGLLLVGAQSSDASVWAWGINSGFTVLGSTLSIVIAQFLGFNRLLLFAAVLYAVAFVAYRELLARLRVARP